MFRCKSDQVKTLLVPNKPKAKSPMKNLSKSRENTPTRKNIHPSSIYKSFSSEERPDEKILKFKDELERHIKASTTTLACHAAEDCMTKIRRNLATEMNRAYEKLYETALQDLNSHMQEMYNSMAGKLLHELENNCRNSGLSIPFEYKLHPLQMPVHAKRGPPKLPPQSFARVYDQLVKTQMKASPSRDSGLSAEELESELYGCIDKEIENLSQKLDIVSMAQIKDEVSGRVQQISNFIMQEMENNINSMVSRLYIEIQAVIEDRMQEILSANVQPMSRPPSAPSLPKLNLEVIHNPSDTSDYIQSIANNYKKY